MNAKKKVVEAMERFRASKIFLVEKAQVVVDFQKLDELYALYRALSGIL